MNSDQLRQFKAIASSGSITSAAKKLYISQPALSMALSKLEDELSCQLFVRGKGHSLRITPDGERLLEYADAAISAIDQATAYFWHEKKCNHIKLYRIGGTSTSLLTEGCYDLKDYRINTILVQNSELLKVASSGVPDIIIADDRYMSRVQHRYGARIPLYEQFLIFSMRKDKAVLGGGAIPAKDLSGIPMIGRTGKMGFNDWLEEVQRANGCSFHYDTIINSATYFMERDSIPLPYLLGSFGIGTEWGREYFRGRRNVRVTGDYTRREISLYYDPRARRDALAAIEKIVSNAERINRQDAEVGYMLE